MKVRCASATTHPTNYQLLTINYQLSMILSSLQNPLVKQLRKLHQAKYRRQQDLFLLEGTHAIEEAVRVQYPLVTACCTWQWQERNPQLWQAIGAIGDRVEVVSLEVLQAVATTVNPDGIVATAPRSQMRAPAMPLKGLGIAVETLQDPGNLGTIVRTAAAAGVEGLWTSEDSVDLDHPKVLRASAGAWFRLPMAATPDVGELVHQCQQQGVQAIATSAKAPVTYWEVDWCRPTLILLGNEGAGLSDALTERADIQVKIPIAPGVESLNVAISAALIVYEACRQRSNCKMC
jgi:RNA methyltransferase, TrmH family